MEINKMDIYPLVFKRIQREQNSEFSMDLQMLSVLMEMNGKNNIGTISKKTNMGLDQMRNTILKLTELGLIEPVEDDATSFLDRAFFDYLRDQLLIAVGPFADILIEDIVNDMGYVMNKFPSYRVNDMISLISKEIRNTDKKAAFVEKMNKRIQSTGYNE